MFAADTATIGLFCLQRAFVVVFGRIDKSHRAAYHFILDSFSLAVNKPEEIEFSFFVSGFLFIYFCWLCLKGARHSFSLKLHSTGWH